MKLLIVLVVTCAVVVSSVPVPSCGSPPPVLQAGSAYLHKDYGHSASGVHGSHHNSAHGGSFFDQKEDHHKTKQVIESESSSKHNKGGSSFGAASGGSFGAFNSHAHGSLTAGSQHQVVG